MYKKILIPAVLILLLTVAAGGRIYAQDSSGQTLVQRIAQRFNLSEAEVQQVFDEEREARHQQMQTRVEERLNQATADGKLTEEQRDALLEKLSDHQDLRTWAQEQGINLSEIMPHGGKFKMRMP